LPVGTAVDLVVSLGIDPAPKLVRTTLPAVSNQAWTTVDLGVVYASPVVVATPIYPDFATPPVVTRVRNAVGGQFEIRIERVDGLTDPVAVDVSVFAVEEGVYTEAVDGVTMEAVRYNSTVTAGKFNWVTESRTLQNAYVDPVVVGQVMSANDPNWSVFWSCGPLDGPITATDFQVGRHVGEDPNPARADETIGYVVIESGSGTINGVAYEAAIGPRSVFGLDNSATPYVYPLSGNLTAASGCVLSQSGMKGQDGSWAVLFGPDPISTTELRMFVVEDTLGDPEQGHVDEHVAYIVFE
jgi:hypothetical protein